MSHNVCIYEYTKAIRVTLIMDFKRVTWTLILDYVLSVKFQKLLN